MSKNLLESICGNWAGVCRTWFEPGKLADESEVSGIIESILDGRFVRHSYEGSIEGKTRKGEETIAFNSVTGKFQIAWFDDFHMNYALMFSEGDAVENGFSVFGKYEISGHPQWGWRTEYDLSDPDSLTITAFNVTPGGEEAKAVETKYRRVIK